MTQKTVILNWFQKLTVNILIPGQAQNDIEVACHSERSEESTLRTNRFFGCKRAFSMIMVRKLTIALRRREAGGEVNTSILEGAV